MGRLGRPSNDNEANRAFGVGGHKGTDWGHGQGDGVCAMADGRVTEVRQLADYGWVIRIDHGHLIASSTQTRYCHLAAGSILVKVGDQVKRGQDIARMGETGSLAQGKHLHSELYLDGHLADEQIYQKEKDMAANTRQVGAGGAKRREKPTTVEPAGHYDPAESYPPGALVDWDGFVRSTLNGGQPNGDNVWLVKDGLYTSWSAMAPMFGEAALKGIKDLGFYPPQASPAPTPAPSTGITKADVEAIVAAIVAASEKRIVDAIKKPVTLAPGHTITPGS